MLKRLSILSLLLGLTLNVQAFDKKTVDLDKEFWGTWTLYNPKTKCTETFDFNKPGNFTYQINKKQLTGEFAVVRSTTTAGLDVLLMDIATDNQKEGCASDNKDYTNAKIQLALKWQSTKAAEICTDTEAKNCTGLFLTKK